MRGGLAVGGVDAGGVNDCAAAFGVRLNRVIEFFAFVVEGVRRQPAGKFDAHKRHRAVWRARRVRHNFDQSDSSDTKRRRRVGRRRGSGRLCWRGAGEKRRDQYAIAIIDRITGEAVGLLQFGHGQAVAQADAE